MNIVYILAPYQSIHLHEREAPICLFLPVLDGVDVEVDGAVEGCQQVAEAGHVRQPDRPGQFSLKFKKIYLLKMSSKCNSPHLHPPEKVPKCLEST